jgi:hypothetical protein
MLSRLRIGCLPLVTLVVAAASTAPCAEARSRLLIGVISPTEGTRSQRIGTAHKASIQTALQEVGAVEMRGGELVELQVEYHSDDSNPEEASRIARDLAARNAVAILGPVNSSCTRAVLAENLDLPVLSALSTAPMLTENPSAWFFRVTADDRKRMQQYAEVVKTTFALQDSRTFLLFEDDAYGQGLAEALHTNLGLPPDRIAARAWPQVVAGMDADLGADERLARGDSLSSELLGQFVGDQFQVFVLGTMEYSLAIARGLDVAVRRDHPRARLTFFFVGRTDQLARGAPEGSITIGDPGDDLTDGILASNRFLGQRFRGNPEGFSMAAYETARYVLPSARGEAVRQADGVDDIPLLRQKLRAVLASGTFESLTPPRLIRFRSDGNLQDSPDSPLYRVNRVLKRIDAPLGGGWVRLVLPRQIRLFEKAIDVVVEGHNTGDQDHVLVRLLRTYNGRTYQEDEKTIVLTGGIGRETFHPTRPGKFSLWTSMTHVPVNPTVDVLMPLNYLWAALAGFVGALMALHARHEQQSRTARLRLLVGMLAGALLYFASSYGRSVPELSALPIPAFGSGTPLHAWLSGLFGGWLGPGLIGFFAPLQRGSGSAAEPASTS